MAKTETPREKVSISITRETRKHLGYIMLEQGCRTPGEAIAYVLTFVDKMGKLKKEKEPVQQVKGLSLDAAANVI